jgi:putative membrane protein
MKPLIYQWHADPLISIIVLALIYVHYRQPGSATAKNHICFWSAFGLVIITTCSPLHFLGMHVYFSAHMIAHVILLLFAGPLLVMSISPHPTAPILKRLSALLYKRSWLAWLTGVGIMWCWHIPFIFDASFAPMNGFTVIPLIHAVSILLAGMVFCWPLMGPFAEDRIHPLTGIIYLATACISCSLLGLLLTFAPIHTYQHYLETGAAMNNSTRVNPWGLSPASDQQAAGLIMWVPCCFVYLAGCLYLMQTWLSKKEPTSLDDEPISLTSLMMQHE